MTKINIQLTFKDYEFRRVKTMGGSPVIYTKEEWIDKMVLIIPVSYNITDRYIEAHFNKDSNDYTVSIESDFILKKRISRSTRVGRAYVPKELIGLDCLIIEAPILSDF